MFKNLIKTIFTFFGKKGKSSFTAIDLFAGCGGLSQGLKEAGFRTLLAVENDPVAAQVYQANHQKTKVILRDICKVSADEIKKSLGGNVLHLLSGCPPCQGFSALRHFKPEQHNLDERNGLVQEYFRLVKELRPLTIMMENVPGIKDYWLFKQIVHQLEELGYKPKIQIVNVKDYGVPQSRKRLVMVGSLLGDLEIAKGVKKKVTVRDTIASLATPEETTDPLHKIIAKHTEKVIERIRLTPKDGGSWKDLPRKFMLKCHQKPNVGFADVYGRLRWDNYSTTITCGCLCPSKGRFLHPEQDRGLTVREAALLQSFPLSYKFPSDISKKALGVLIGNALPPQFSYIQAQHISNHIHKYLRL